MFSYCRFLILLYRHLVQLHHGILEYDGIQHFRPVKYFGGKKAFVEQKKRDELKSNYCSDKDIYLIRIPYTEDIQSVLDIHLFNRRENLLVDS